MNKLANLIKENNHKKLQHLENLDSYFLNYGVQNV